jgi:hypothetical protein
MSNSSKEDLDKRVTTQGIYDPPEPDEALPDGVQRERKGPLNKNTGRRPALPEK